MPSKGREFESLRGQDLISFDEGVFFCFGERGGFVFMKRGGGFVL